jgi:hypothetical protein
MGTPRGVVMVIITIVLTRHQEAIHDREHAHQRAEAS